MAIWATSFPQLLSGTQSAQPSVRKYMPGAPEIFFTKQIDNSRLVRVADPSRRRELTMFTVAIAVFSLLAMVYLWQHFSAIEYGYKIESLRSQRDAMTDINKSLRLEEASLKDPARIDGLARSLGMQMPQAGQVQHMDATAPDAGSPVMARAVGISVVSLAP